jgi:Fe(3+) dicitrate transport protein
MKHIISVALLLLAQSSLAQTEPNPPAATTSFDPVTKKNHILVTDDMEDFVVNTATPQRVSKEKIELYKYTDVNRVLRQTAGVYVREEEGQGLRPNIGLRGTNPDRSKKVVLMEDGVLIGPAPYSAPAAYYTPLMNHVESMEVYKGFAGVPYGPNSIGGAINYTTLGIPTKFTPKLEMSSGAYNTNNLKASVGGETKGGVQYLLQASRLSSDGFKNIDRGGPTGFLKDDAIAKLRFKLPSWEGTSQQLEFRLGYSDENSHESYLGLSQDDFNASPYRRYSASALDDMQWKHEQVQIEHNLQISSNSQIKTTIYRHDFHRTWFRMDRFTGSSPSLYDVLGDPQANPAFYNILTGKSDSSTQAGNGNLVAMNNDRAFYSQGIQTRWNGNYTIGNTRHDIEMGVRYHQDQIKRNHGIDTFAMTNGILIRTADPRAAQDINRNHADAFTVSLLENMQWNKWVFTVLGRFENVKFNYRDSLAGTYIRRGDTVAAPGLGVLYKITDLFSIKGSVNSGVSVAGLSDNGGEAKEKSTNYEFGLKYISQDAATQAELILFYNDYSNITGTCTSSTGCGASQLDKQYNGGSALIRGLEGRISQNLQYGKLGIPLQLNLTLLDAQFTNTFDSTTPEWGVGTVQSGDPLPYVPRVQYTITAGTVYGKFTEEFAIVYQKDVYDQSAALNRRQIPAYGIIDWTGRYLMNKNLQLFGRIDNLLDRKYEVSLRPFGARPGKPRSFMVGLSYTF